jgi:DNA-binding CsgD family transcriptional regulator
MKTFPDLVHRSLDAMFAIDGKQRVTVWNQACEDLTGISAIQAIGSLCHEILQGHEPSGRVFCGANCPLNQLAKGGPPPSNFAMRIAGNGGGKIQVNVGTLLMPSPDNREWMVVHVMRRGHCKSSAGFFDRDDPGKDSFDEEHLKQMDEHASRGLCLLSERERQILRLLTHGQSTDAISGHLHISMTTVRNHIQRLMAKMNVHSRIEAVTCANRHHLV